MIPLELLAPARTCAIAQKAVMAGADAVFIGGPSFGARAGAGNSLSDLKALCDFAHQFKVKIHLTLNTLLFDDEVDKAQELICAYHDCGADALIIQDPVIFTLDIPKGLELHASTQCFINTMEKLKFYEALGVSQAVLPRELSVSEIETFHKACPSLRLEAFIAGALCVSESGNCFMSEAVTGRSANRGQCAQLCRLPMQFYRGDELLKEGHLLSLKDNEASALLPALIKAGVSSFKIEGRLKDEAFVLNNTAFYSELLDKICQGSGGAYGRASFGRSLHAFKPDPEKTFNRTFTCGLLKGRNVKLARIETPKFTGPEVAKVQEARLKGNTTEIKAAVKDQVALNNQDGLTFFSKGSLTGFAVNTAGKDGLNALITVHGRVQVKKGDILYRNQDTAFLKELGRKDAAVRELKLKCVLSLETAGNEISAGLSYEDEAGRKGQSELCFVPDPDAAALSQDKAFEVLGKRPAPCYARALPEIKGDGALLKLSSGRLNALRKEAAAALLASFKPVSADFVFKAPGKLPQYPAPAVDGRLVLNQKTREFYRSCGAEVSADPNPPVMSCAWCLIKAYGRCGKTGAPTDGYRLKIGPNLFEARCDRERCRMLLKKVRP